MKSVSWEQAAEAMGGQSYGAGGPITGAATDDRDVRPGDLFFAISGARVDGHQFVEVAYRSGAVGAVTLRPIGDVPCIVVDDTVAALGRLGAWQRDRLDIAVIGVTGSAGKTSVKEMIAAALGAAKNEGNLNTEIGVPVTLCRLSGDEKILVQEMAMRGRGQIAELCRIAKPIVGAITNIGWSHVEELGSKDKIAAAKAELLEALPANGLAVLPRDDDYFAFLRSRVPCRWVSFGSSPDADSHVEALSDDRQSARIRVGGEEHEVRLPAPGMAQAMNAACALAVARGLGRSIDVDAIGRATLPDLRWQVLTSRHGATIIADCYNASPDSMRQALTELSLTEATRKIAVLGGMRELGEYSLELHEQLGRDVFSADIDLLVSVGEDLIADAAVAAGMESWRVEKVADAESAARWLNENLAKGDAALIKGSRAIGLEAILKVVI